MTEYDNIELRSEKVRNIISKVPPELVTGGTAYIVLLLFVLLFATVLIPYPENIRAEIVVTSIDRKRVYAEALIPYRYITRINKGTAINVELEGYTAQKYGFNNGIVKMIDDSVVSRNGNTYFRALLDLRSPLKYEVKMNMQGIVNITIADRTILLYFLGF